MIAASLYRLALRAFPRRHRDLYAAEMIDAFQRELDAGRRSRPAFVVAACINAITTGIAERRRHHVVRLGYAFSALDFTLAWRILLRYPGLSVVSIFGMAIGIAICGVAFTVTSAIMNPRLPLEDDERIVSLLNWDASTTNNEMRLANDFAAWRALTSVEDLGLTRTVQRNLIVPGRAVETVRIAEISVSAFRVTRVNAFRGRYLLPEDESPSAEGALVIGYDEWLRRFDGAPDVVGRKVQLGNESYTIVGVMPESYGFPTNYSFWIPWRTDPALYAPRTGPIATVFGRLAPGATLNSAQAELSAIGSRRAAELPDTHQHLVARVVPYANAFNDMADPDNAVAMYAIRLAIVLLLVIVCVNVAILVYARTATRQGEIAVRGALGASRVRIVAQLFVEALTLAGVAASIGVALMSVAVPRLEAAFVNAVGGVMPFWITFDVSIGVVIYIVGLTLLAASIVGVFPALKVTRRSVQTRLQTLSPGSGSRMHMGRMWTMLIVAQVALTVALLPAAMFYTWDGLRLRTGDSGFASREFMTATLASDRSSEAPTAEREAAFRSRYRVSFDEIEPRLRAEPAVADVAFSMANVGEELAMVIEGEGQPLPLEPVDYNIVGGKKMGHLARFNRVSENFFAAFDVPMMIGRYFQPGDVRADRVIVSRTLADRVFGSANPLGQRIKYVGVSREAQDRAPAMERWLEIIGVVPDFPVNQHRPEPRLYHAADIEDVYPAQIALRVRTGDPAAMSGKLRDISAAVNPNLQVRNISTAEIIVRNEQGMFRMIGVTVGLVMVSVIVLSAAGIYSLMAFTVARRRREIGIRAALGADRNRLLMGIFSRTLAQLGAGAAIGMVAAFALEQALEGEMFQGYGAVILPLVAVVMAIVGVLAAIGPARQGLSIQPTEALREE